MSTANPSSNKVFFFKCEQNAANNFEKLFGFYEENEFVDTVLIAGTECVEVQVHRIVLSASSEYFLQLFRANTTGAGIHKTELLKDTDSSIFKSIINFMYTGSIELSLEKVESILTTAILLKMQTLVDGCIDFIQKHLSVRNCLKWLRFAKELNLSGLKEKSLNYTFSNFEKVSKKTEILLLDEMELKDLLFKDNFHEDLEEHVFMALVHWIEYDKSNRQHLTLQLLPMIRYQLLTPKFIIKNRKSVCKTVESYELIDGWLEWHWSPETQSIDLKNAILEPRKDDGKLRVISWLHKKGNINIQTYDKEMEAWSSAKEISHFKNKIASAWIVIEEKLILVGGLIKGKQTNIMACLDLHTFKWTTLPSMPQNRMASTAAYLNGNLFVFSGYVEMTNPTSLLVYNFTKREWKDLQFPFQPHGYSAIAACNEVFYIADFHNGYLMSLDLSCNQWTSKTLKKEPLFYFGFAAVEGFLYIIGGSRDVRGEHPLNTVWRYNLSNDSWSEMAPLPQSCKCVKVAVLGTKIVICQGGYTNQTIQEYDLNSNTWNTLNSKLLNFPADKHLIIY